MRKHVAIQLLNESHNVAEALGATLRVFFPAVQAQINQIDEEQHFLVYLNDALHLNIPMPTSEEFKNISLYQYHDLMCQVFFAVVQAAQMQKASLNGVGHA